jgi:para-nitrobenzyl esterase
MKSFGFASRFIRRWSIPLCGLVLTAGAATAVASASLSTGAAGAARAVRASASIAGTDAAAPTSSGATACAHDTTVQTVTGPVCGIVRDGDSQWLGIPYASPPVGNLRWKPPQPHAPWTTPLQATAFGSECLQGAIVPAAGSEDCLFVNVVRPTGPTPSSGLPVLVHIHGGGFVVGNGDGDYSLLANTGHEVVVSMNYRLGVLGFFADAALGSNSGDYGLEDQQAALRWVQDNIRAFGGDPHNVTIFGESAGGSSVCDAIASPSASGLFEKAFSVSGEYSTLFESADQLLNFQDCKSTPLTQDQADAAGSGFAAAVGCVGSSDVAACLRDVPATVAVQDAAGGFSAGGTGTITPTLNAEILPLSLRQALARGKANHVRVVAGTARDENLDGSANNAEQYFQLVDSQFGAHASAVLSLYPLSRFYSPYVAFRTVAADAYTVCPAIVTDEDLARRMPVYGYEIDYGDPPPASFEPADEPNGSYHVAAWFVLPMAGLDLDPNQRVLQQQEVADLTTFARTGNPTGDFTPTWPEFNSSSEVMSWAPGGDSQIMTTAEMSLDHNCGFWDRISPTP